MVPFTKTPVFALLVLLFLVVISAVWYTLSGDNTSRYSATETPYKVLVAENPAFSAADARYRSGDYEDALAIYAEALESVTDPVQEGQVRYKIAIAKEVQGDYRAAIQDMKFIAADPDYSRFVKAYAVQRLGIMYNTYGYTHPEIVEETFKDEPYASLREGDDLALSYRRIFEYASSFFPLGVAESRIADWYANEMLRVRESASQEEISALVAQVRSHLQKAENDIERIRNDPNASGDVPAILVRKGEILYKLSQVGEATLDEAEGSFRRGLQLAVLSGPEPGRDGYPRFHFASFLERAYGTERAADIRTILGPLYTESSNADTPVMDFLRSQRNANTWMNVSLRGMAEIDPEFRRLLISLGWTEADLAS